MARVLFENLPRDRDGFIRFSQREGRDADREPDAGVLVAEAFAIHLGPLRVSMFRKEIAPIDVGGLAHPIESGAGDLSGGRPSALAPRSFHAGDDPLASARCLLELPRIHVDPIRIEPAEPAVESEDLERSPRAGVGFEGATSGVQRDVESVAAGGRFRPRPERLGDDLSGDRLTGSQREARDQFERGPAREMDGFAVDADLGAAEETDLDRRGRVRGADPRDERRLGGGAESARLRVGRTVSPVGRP